MVLLLTEGSTVHSAHISTISIAAWKVLTYFIHGPQIYFQKCGSARTGVLSSRTNTLKNFQVEVSFLNEFNSSQENGRDHSDSKYFTVLLLVHDMANIFTDLMPNYHLSCMRSSVSALSVSHIYPNLSCTKNHYFPVLKRVAADYVDE